MRFLLCDKEILTMTFLILLVGPQIGGNNITAAERAKIEDSLELLINKYFKLDKSFKQLKALSKKMDPIQSEDLQKFQQQSVSEYYRAKLEDNYRFETEWDHYGQTENDNLLQTRQEESQGQNSRQNADSSSERDSDS